MSKLAASPYHFPSADRERLSTDPQTGSGSTGALGNASGTGGPAANIYYMAMYFDAASRPTDSVNVGTNGGSAYTRPGTVPTRSDTAHVTSTGYGTDGLPSVATDPRGIQSLQIHDMLGQTIKTIAAWDGTSGATPTSSTNQTTTFTFDGIGDETSMTAVMPSGTASQTTDWIYGVAGGTSAIFSNDLLSKVEYPDATTGAASTSSTDDVTYTRDALGETTGMTDQNGTVHADSYDVLGRPTLDSITTLGSGVDGSVRAIGTNYNTQGLPFQETSYSDAAATTVVNQDQDVYNGLGQLTGEYQAHSGAVNTSTTPEVQYAFSDPSLGSRQTSMTYPNGRQLDYVYNSGIDTTIGRVSAIADHAGSAAGADQGYVYQGLATIVGNTDGNGVTETTTLDGFGQTSETKYVNGSSVTTDDFAYGHDRNGNVLYKNNLLSSGQSELYHANSTASGDNNTASDPLNRLTGFARGTLSSSGNNGTALDTVSSAVGSQSWSVNAVGAQSSVTTNGTTTTNTTNAKNELTANGSNTLTFDHNGNTLTDENGQTTKYDAWDHAVTVKNSGNTTIASFSYDPHGWRITETSGGTTTDVYFTNQWQAIEERQSGTVTRQNVWGLGYVNQLVERDDNSTTGSLGITSSGLGRRLYAQQDANWNVTSLVNATGSVVQRMTYLPYGAVTFLTASWSGTSDGSAQSVLFQGGRFESATGNYIFDNRDYDPATGAWKESDPAGYINGADTYQMEGSGPIERIDPSGLATLPNPTSPNWGPINPVTGQPNYMPPLPAGNEWKPVANPKFDPSNPWSRPGKWVPMKPVKVPGGKGGQPQGSWDPVPSKKYPNGHGDVDDGAGGSGHVDGNGNPIPACDAHKYIFEGWDSPVSYVDSTGFPYETVTAREDLSRYLKADAVHQAALRAEWDSKSLWYRLAHYNENPYSTPIWPSSNPLGIAVPGLDPLLSSGGGAATTKVPAPVGVPALP